jgi:hypothetical protein
MLKLHEELTIRSMKCGKLSFDWKVCNRKVFIKQKLNYLHDNPCSGKWNLCNGPIDYLHSSAKYYLSDEDGFYVVTDVEDG